jgi:hypothetical protein
VLLLLLLNTGGAGGGGGGGGNPTKPSEGDWLDVISTSEKKKNQYSYKNLRFGFSNLPILKTSSVGELY